MIYRITGRLVEKTPTSLVVDVGGIAYEICVPLSTFESVGKISDEVTLFTSLVVREDDIQLYGFISGEEQRLFRLLIGVSGIGPKTAISLLSSASVQDIFSFVSTSNIQALVAIPGIGRKTAERMVLELRDKVQRAGIESAGRQLEGGEDVRADAVDALVALGYARLQCERAIREVVKNDPDAAKSTQDLVRAALKHVR